MKTLVGHYFGQWEVIEDGGVDVKCKCRCGAVKFVRKQNLKDGRSTSCGCMRGELVSKKVSAWRKANPRGKSNV